jgi:hypothetical protein
VIVGGIAVVHAQIQVFDIYIDVRKDQFVFDKMPNDSGHFIAI